MSDSIIKFENFGFKYNAQTTKTLYDINLEIHRGEKILIAGPSGCGKSTLVHCINGLIPFSYKGEIEGSLTIDGADTRELSIFEISKHVGTVLQDSDAQFVGLTVAEDIAFALENDCIKEPDLHERVSRVARMVDIDRFLSHAPGDISGGQKQRVSLAGVMVDDVDVLLFDEPLANLDPATGKQAIELIDDIHRQTEATIIIVEHRLEDVLHRDVDRIILMSEGHIVADMTPDMLLSSSLLEEAGIREPLYITALKYAGVKITPDIKPAHIDSIELDSNAVSNVKEWYTSTSRSEGTVAVDNILEVRDVSFAYGESNRLVLEDISLSVKRGEMVAIVGTNGAGKSTFAKILCGFEHQKEGSITLNGSDLTCKSIKERAEHIGYVMQDPNQMISKVMIMDEVALGLRTRGVDEEEIARRVEATLKVCGLWKMRNWPISALSYGQKKRVTIASILVLDPELIILDEPTAGQDYRHYTEIMEFLSDINRMGITVVMITHDMHLMLEYADRSIVFAHGNVIADDNCAAILTNESIITEANLKETSLYSLAIKCGIDDPTSFVQHFIDYERSNVRSADSGIGAGGHYE